MKKYLFVVIAMMMLSVADVKAIVPQPSVQDGDTLEFFTYIRPSGFTVADMREEFVAWGLELIDPNPPVVMSASAGGGTSLEAVAPGGVSNDNISFEITEGDNCFVVFKLQEDLGETQCRIRIHYFPNRQGVHVAKLRMNCAGRTPKVVTLRGYAKLAGDMNNDDVLDVSDVTSVIRTVLSNGAGDFNCADIDGSETVDVADVTLLINQLLSVD